MRWIKTDADIMAVLPATDFHIEALAPGKVVAYEVWIDRDGVIATLSAYEDREQAETLLSAIAGWLASGEPMLELTQGE